MFGTLSPCAEAVQSALTSPSGAIALSVGVDLMCLWKKVSSGSFYTIMLDWKTSSFSFIKVLYFSGYRSFTFLVNFIYKYLIKFATTTYHCCSVICKISISYMKEGSIDLSVSIFSSSRVVLWTWWLPLHECPVILIPQSLRNPWYRSEK